MSRVWTPADEQAQARRTRRYFELWGYTFAQVDEVPVVEVFGFDTRATPFAPVIQENQDRLVKLFNALREENAEHLDPLAASALATADLALAGLVYPNSGWRSFDLVRKAVAQRRLCAKLPQAEKAKPRERL